MKLKELGAMYLILGTCVAAGMLGLPVVTASTKFSLTIWMLLSAWVLMGAGAWALLQVNLWLPSGTNLISMTEITLGKVVKYVTWCVYLLLLYSLICAYLAASGDLLQNLLHALNLHLPRSLATLLATLILGSMVYRGIQTIDNANRILMTVKLIFCFLLILVVMPHVKFSNLMIGNNTWHGASWLVIICSFGYAVILPSIREYLESNRKQLNRALFIGSIIPLILYFLWIIAIQGALPKYGNAGLVAMNDSPNTNSMLMMQVSYLTHLPILKSLSAVFISICSITGFLGVSLCLMDFLADGLKKAKQGRNKKILAALTFLIPMGIVIINPAIFIHALAYAGLCCLYIVVLLPLAMYAMGKWKGIDKYS